MDTTSIPSADVAEPPNTANPEEDNKNANKATSESPVPLVAADINQLLFETDVFEETTFGPDVLAEARGLQNPFEPEVLAEADGNTLAVGKKELKKLAKLKKKEKIKQEKEKKKEAKDIKKAEKAALKASTKAAKATTESPVPLVAADINQLLFETDVFEETAFGPDVLAGMRSLQFFQPRLNHI